MVTVAYRVSQVLLAVVTVLDLSCLCDSVTVTVSPPNLIVPVGTNVTFLCEVHNSTESYDIHWKKNNNLIDSTSAYDNTLQIYPTETPEINYNYSRLTIQNTGSDLDNTTFQCVIIYFGFHNNGLDRTESNNVTLLVINESKSSVVPNLQTTIGIDHPSVHLLWSPPYLWSGEYIDYFNISIKRKSDGKILYSQRVAVSEMLIDREIESVTICKALNYSEDMVFFEIKAYRINRDMRVILLNGIATFNETEGFPSSLGELQLNARVLVDTNSTSLLKTQIELPKLCSYEEITLEYTIIDSDNHGVYKETFSPDIESKVFHHEIDSIQINLKLNQEYTLKVIMTQSTLGMKNITSERSYNFKTVFCTSNSYSFQPNIRSTLLLMLIPFLLYILCGYY